MPAWAGVALICCCSLRSQQPFANPFKIRFASQQVFEAGVNSMLILFKEGMIGDICL